MWSPDSVTDDSIVFLVITRTEFTSALVITKECLQYLRGPTTSLQEEAKDIVQAVSEIKTLTSSLKQVRKNVDSYHSRWFETVSKCVMRWGLHHQCPGYVVVSITEQAYLHLIPLNTLGELSQFQFWTIFFLSLTSGLVHIKTAFQGLYLVPSVLVTEDLATVSSVVMKVGELYALDLPNVSCRW